MREPTESHFHPVQNAPLLHAAHRVRLTAERFATLKRQLHEASTDRSEAIREALAAGMTHREVAKHTGLSRQRVTQLGEIKGDRA